MPALFAAHSENHHAWGRGLALFLIFSFVAVNLALGVHEIVHFGHEHNCADTDNGCAICLVVQAAQSLNLKLFVSGVPALPALFFLAAVTILNKPRVGVLFNATPVDLKVRLNN
jgi:hypothetical protein